MVHPCPRSGTSGTSGLVTSSLKVPRFYPCKASGFHQHGPHVLLSRTLARRGGPKRHSSHTDSETVSASNNRLNMLAASGQGEPQDPTPGDARRTPSMVGGALHNPREPGQSKDGKGADPESFWRMKSPKIVPPSPHYTFHGPNRSK